VSEAFHLYNYKFSELAIDFQKLVFPVYQLFCQDFRKQPATAVHRRLFDYPNRNHSSYTARTQINVTTDLLTTPYPPDQLNHHHHNGELEKHFGGVRAFKCCHLTQLPQAGARKTKMSTARHKKLLNYDGRRNGGREYGSTGGLGAIQ